MHARARMDFRVNITSSVILFLSSRKHLFHIWMTTVTNEFLVVVHHFYKELIVSNQSSWTLWLQNFSKNWHRGCLRVCSLLHLFLRLWQSFMNSSKCHEGQVLLETTQFAAVCDILRSLIGHRGISIPLPDSKKVVSFTPGNKKLFKLPPSPCSSFINSLDNQADVLQDSKTIAEVSRKPLHLLCFNVYKNNLSLILLYSRKEVNVYVRHTG